MTPWRVGRAMKDFEMFVQEPRYRCSAAGDAKLLVQAGQVAMDGWPRSLKFPRHSFFAPVAHEATADIQLPVRQAK